MKLTPLQQRVLRTLADGGYLAYGMYGGITGTVYSQYGTFAYGVHANVIKSLVKRDLVRKDEESRRLVISDSGRAAIEGRTANGVCPCCTRSFVQLQRHMASKHPEYAGE